MLITSDVTKNKLSKDKARYCKIRKSWANIIYVLYMTCMPNQYQRFY